MYAALDADLKANLYSGTLNHTLKANLKSPKNGLINMNFNINGADANELISNANNNFVGTSNLEKTFRNLDNTIYGQADVLMKLKTSGVPRTLMENLNGRIDFLTRNGKITGGSFVDGYNQAAQAIPGVKEMKEVTFNKFESVIEVVNGDLQVKHMDIKESPVGFLGLTGTIKLDGNVDLTLENHLPKWISSPILKQQSAGSSALSSLTGKVGFQVDPGMGFQTNNKGEVLAYFGIKGSLNDPSFTIAKKTFGKSPSAAASNLVAEQKAKLNKELQKQKAAAKAKLDAEKAKTKARIKAEKEKALKKKRELEAKAKAKAEKEKKKAKDKAKQGIKDGLKKFGF